LPLIGALYIPNGSSTLYTLFPKQEQVSGLFKSNALYKGKRMQQYISRGLGASSSISFLNFRLFNSPEINLLILVK
jgi:predicted MPP superfamily phosphohydrolase